MSELELIKAVVGVVAIALSLILFHYAWKKVLEEI